MPAFDAIQLAHWTAGHWTERPVRVLTGFTQDTRAIRSGDIFIALRTPKRDGHDYLSAAQAAGASAAIVSTPTTTLTLPQLVVADPLAAFQKIAAAHRAAFQVAGGIVIGISGSCGKTSTKNLLALLLAEAHGAPATHSTEGNLNNHIGVPLTLTRLDPARHRYAVIEAGISAPGEMETLATMIAPDHAIITMVAPAHTQDLGGLEGVAREKAILLQHVLPGGTRLFPESCLSHAPFRALPVNSPLSFSLQSFRLSELFPSRGMAQNAALAITLALRLGVSEKQIQTTLARWQPAKWRGELVRDPGTSRLFYLDFYNANPASMADALDAFATVAPSAHPRLYVLGCMEELGTDSPRYHRELGKTLSLLLRPQDEAILIGDHASDINRGMEDEGEPARPQPTRVQIVTDTAIIAARVVAFDGAIFLKGSRRYALEKTLPPNLAPKEPHP